MAGALSTNNQPCLSEAGFSYTQEEYGMDEKKYQKDQQCSGPECERNARAHGLCLTHYKQERTGRELFPIGTWKRPGKEECNFPECGRKHYALGLCFQHYKAKRAGRELKPIRADQKKDGE